MGFYGSSFDQSLYSCILQHTRVHDLKHATTELVHSQLQLPLPYFSPSICVLVLQCCDGIATHHILKGFAHFETTTLDKKLRQARNSWGYWWSMGYHAISNLMRRELAIHGYCRLMSNRCRYRMISHDRTVCLHLMNCSPVSIFFGQGSIYSSLGKLATCCDTYAIDFLNCHHWSMQLDQVRSTQTMWPLAGIALQSFLSAI